MVWVGIVVLLLSLSSDDRVEASGELAASLRMTDAVPSSAGVAATTTAGATVHQQDERPNSLFCTMEPVTVRCLIDRQLKYVFPFECLLNRSQSLAASESSSSSSEEKESRDGGSVELLVMAGSVDPVSPAFLPLFPLVVDHSIPRQDMQSCPCNCEIDCRSPASTMYTIERKTACQDCRCLSDDPSIGCECYDHFDLEFKDLDPHMRQVLEHHVSRRTRD